MNTTGKIHTNKDDEMGGYSIEAAIILPIIIMSILAMVILIRLYQANWRMSHIIKDELALSVSRAYILEKDFLLKSRIEKRALSERSVVLDSIEIEDNLNFNERDSLVKGFIYYHSKLRLPVFNIKTGERLAIACGRKFIGDKKKKIYMSFDEMEEEGNFKVVFIFPKDGEKYHLSSCRTVTPKAEKITLNEELRNTYSPCKICIRKGGLIGSQVLIFRGYGHSYHSKLCSLVMRNVEKTRKDIAQEKGYEACKICRP